MESLPGRRSSDDSSDDSSAETPQQEGAVMTREGPLFLDRPQMVRRLEELKPNTLFHKKYEMKALSVPGKLQIRFARQLDGDPESVVLKFYHSEDLFHNSIEIHSRLTSAYCSCKLIEALEEGTGYPPCIVFPMGQHTLSNWVKIHKPSMTDRRWCLHQILTAIDELHDQDIVHCDLKPTNIMFFEVDTRWKLMDFDSARIDGDRMHGAFTVAYAPPEVLFSVGEAEQPCIKKSIDMWAFGILAYEVLTGERMYTEGADLHEVRRAMENKEVEAKVEKLEERAHKKLVSNLVKREPEERWTTRRALANGTFRSARPHKKKENEAESSASAAATTDAAATTQAT